MPTTYVNFDIKHTLYTRRHKLIDTNKLNFPDADTILGSFTLTFIPRDMLAFTPFIFTYKRRTLLPYPLVSIVYGYDIVFV